jgi:mannose-1-phosphate guanylyltransferase / mannose-6-phosphate isomerase
VNNNLIVPVVICGGSGTRLWPASRETRPKQFLPLTGGLSTFQQTLLRVSDRTLFARPVVVTNAEFRFTVADQIQTCGVEADILLEPVARDSGPAICVATEFVSRRDPTACVLVLAADHMIRDDDAFRTACTSGVAAANTGRIVTFGVIAATPETRFGYIKRGARLEDSDAFAVDAFVEKPDAATAAQYVADGYLWNSGNFLFRAVALLSEVERLEPQMRAVARDAIDGLIGDLDFQRIPEGVFSQAPKISIDYAVMERTPLAAVLPVDFGWSDVGNWASLWQELDRDGDGNATDGSVVLLDTRNSLVRSDETMLTTVVGLDDVVVVATADAVLVMARHKAEAVKELVETLKSGNHAQATQHRRIYRPWGYYQAIDAGPRYQVKRIVVKPGGKLSLQKHFHRAEHWVVVTGTAEVELNDTTRIMRENESIDVPIGSIHRLANPGKISLELIEVQVGSYLGEDDILRFDDVYRRD